MRPSPAGGAGALLSRSYIERVHYLTAILVDDAGPIRADIVTRAEEMLERYDETRDVEPRAVEIPLEEIAPFAAEQGVALDDLEALVALVPQWCNREGTIADGHLAYLTTSNPEGYWDWYEHGGRYSGLIPRDLCLVRDLPEGFNCFYLVTPDGEIHKPFDHDHGLIGEGGPQWKKVLGEALSAHPDAFAVVMDLHS